MKKQVLVIQGPNLNLLGERETGIYGKESFEDINNQILDCACELGFECDIFQSNKESHAFGSRMISSIKSSKFAIIATVL